MSVEKINPKIDFVFRKLFGSEENKDLLISLINSVVGPELVLTDVVIKNPFNLATYGDEKESILDIKAQASGGKWYNVEMQLTPHPLYGRRAVFYVAELYTEQLQPGEDYSHLNPTIGIHFLDFPYFQNDNRFVRHFMLKDAETNECPSSLDCIRLYFVEMSKFNKDWPELRTSLDRWVAFLNRARELDRRSVPDRLKDEPVIVKAVDLLERIGSDPTQRAIYEGEVKKKMIDQIQIRDAEERGKRQLIVDLMVNQIGEPPVDIQMKLNSLSTGELRDFGFALFKFTSYDDVERWLTKH